MQHVPPWRMIQRNIFFKPKNFFYDSKNTFSAKTPPNNVLYVLSFSGIVFSKSIDKTGTLPRPNIIRIVDDGTYSQLIIELENLSLEFINSIRNNSNGSLRTLDWGRIRWKLPLIYCLLFINVI